MLRFVCFVSVSERCFRRACGASSARGAGGPDEHAPAADQTAGHGGGLPRRVAQPAGCVEPLLLFPGDLLICVIG